MANEITLNDTPGKFLVAVIGNLADATWAGANLFVTRTNVTVLAHPVAVNEIANTGQYAGSFPAAITAPGWYRYEVYEVASSGVILLAEVQAGPILTGMLQWDGTAEILGSTATLYGDNGSIPFTYTVYDVDETTPLAGVAVKVSAENPALHYSQTKITDALGKVQFNLNAGNAYFWRSRFDRGFTDPDIEVVS